MQQPATPKPREPALPVALVGLVAALTALGCMPIWVTDLLPLLDAASHLHLITIIHDFHGEPWYPHYYQEVHAIVPYLTYYKAVDWLAYLGDVEWANRVVLTAALALLPVASLAVLRATRQSPWLVLGVFPWMLNSDFFMGFFSYLLSIPLFLLLLAAHLRMLERPDRTRMGLFVLSSLFLVLTHYLLWGIALVMLPVLSVWCGARRGPLAALRDGAREALLLLPSVLVLVPWFAGYFLFNQGQGTSDHVVVDTTRPLLDRLLGVYGGEHYGPLRNFEQILERFLGPWPDGPAQIKGPLDLVQHHPSEFVSLLWILGAVLWAITAIRDREAHGQRSWWAGPNTREREGHDDPARPGHVDFGRTWLRRVLALFVAAYFLLPAHLTKPLYLHGVNFRLVEVLMVLGVLALPLEPLRMALRGRLTVHVGTICFIAAATFMPVRTAGAFMLARTEYGSIRQAMDQIPPGKDVLTLRTRGESAFLEQPAYRNIGEYYGVMRGGYVPYSFADTSSKPVKIRPEHRRPAPAWYDQNAFRYEDHGQYYDYIVVYRHPADSAPRFEQQLKKLPLIWQRDRWSIYYNADKQAWPPPPPPKAPSGPKTPPPASDRNAVVDHIVDAVLQHGGLLSPGEGAPVSPDDRGAVRIERWLGMPPASDRPPAVAPRPSPAPTPKPATGRPAAARPNTIRRATRPSRGRVPTGRRLLDATRRATNVLVPSPDAAP